MLLLALAMQAGCTQNFCGRQASPHSPGQRWPHASCFSQRWLQGSRSQGTPQGSRHLPFCWQCQPQGSAQGAQGAAHCWWHFVCSQVMLQGRLQGPQLLPWWHLSSQLWPHAKGFSHTTLQGMCGRWPWLLLLLPGNRAACHAAASLSAWPSVLPAALQALRYAAQSLPLSLLPLLLLPLPSNFLHCRVPSSGARYSLRNRSHLFGRLSVCTAAALTSIQSSHTSCTPAADSLSPRMKLPTKPSLKLLLLPRLLLPHCSSSAMQRPHLLLHTCSQPEMRPSQLWLQQVGSSRARAALPQGSVAA
jgi:hypothetical protein